MTLVLAAEWAPYGVTVNAIGPAAIPSPLSQLIFADDPAASGFRPHPDGSLRHDVIGAAAFLVLAAAAFVTGQTLFVDGGRAIG